MRLAPLFSLLFLLIAAPLRAQQDSDFKVFFFGNSLIQHLSDSPETSVPHWLHEIAKARGRGFAVDGTWGFLRQFSANLPPEPNWSFETLPNAWNSERQSFAAAGFDAVVINTANFIQYQPPTAEFDGDNPRGESPLSATLDVFDWAAAHTPEARFFIYEGWTEMAGKVRSFPPDDAGFRTYLEANKGSHHGWHEAYADAVRDARPDLDLTLIPVASTLPDLLNDTALSGLTARDLFTDDAPHGTPTLYFLAALITYGPLFGDSLPDAMELPASIHRLVRQNFKAIAAALSGGHTASVMPEQVPAAAPEVPGIPALAMGLNGIADWSTEYPFIDVMKTARPWIGHLPDQWGGWDADRLQAEGYLGENGWPLRLPDGVNRLESFILSDLLEQAANFRGRYRLTYRGKAKLQLLGRARDVVSKPGEVWFSFTPGEGLVALSLTAIDPDDPIRDIRVIHENHIPFHDLGEVFNPDWIALIRDLRAVRFMDWMDTNASPVVGWDDRPALSDYTYVRRGVPLELMLRLANEIGADPWFNMPHKADDDFVRQFAETVRAGLKPGLKAYVEYSNELWNFGFAQTRWAQEQAAERWPGNKAKDAWMQFAGMRAAQVAGIWTDVFGDETKDRLVRVIATHTGWPGLEEALLQAPLWLQEGKGIKPPAGYFDAYAVTGYFGYEMGGDDFAPRIKKWLRAGTDEAIAQTLKALKQGSVRELTQDLFPYHAKVANEHGLDLVMYEGGTHVVGHGTWINDEALTAFYERFNYSPEVAALYRDVMTAWTEVGGTLFNAFVDVANASQWGSWGARRHLGDQNPRWDALMHYNHKRPADWDPRPGAAFSNGLSLGGRSGQDLVEGTPRRDVLVGRGGDDWMIGNGGADAMHGGDGTDTAVLPGAFTDYRFSWMGPFLMADGPQGEVKMLSVERLEFDSDPGQLYAVTPKG
ncbi:calcium-binding protein [Thalassovita aquimarina]|uniref:Calcium-binding protein n=1 Tax=Thalassovita aquimarina TaxID=2785917 RepID=A0ABS5HNP9_9RHOB|nr:calcium-binding protein [Thalassovita aquimarina]MBR9650567.1 calcium-binding protein [Thalassovita aquimarina]